MSEPTVRPTVTQDLDAIAGIYAHHVRTGVAYRHTVEDSIYLAVDAEASLALHRNRGFVDAGRLTAVGFKRGRWLDTVLLQRTISRGGR